MESYTIRKNDQFNSIEVIFSGKPSEAIRTALKGLRFRWHGVKKLWYGYAEEDAVRAAIDGQEGKEDKPETYSLETTEAYMGAVGFVGSNANKHLYGAELSQAIRDAIKKDGIKGVSVAKDTYSMGQSIRVTVPVTDADILTVDQLIDSTSIFDYESYGWIPDTDIDWRPNVSIDTVNGWPQEKIDRVHKKLAEEEIARYKRGKTSINHYHIDSYKVFTGAFKAKLHRVTLIAQSFNYSDSNAMVDYYDVNFYFSLYAKYRN